MDREAQQPCVPILMYHSISNSTNRKFLPFTVSPETFAWQMAYLHQRQYTPLTVTQYVLARSGYAGVLPDRPVVITFDDGFADFFTDAFPVLQRYRFPATLYITTAYVGGTSRWLEREGEQAHPMLTWDQIRTLQREGIECGGHTQSHPQLDLLSITRAHDEIMGCKHVLEHQIGQAVTSFAYPYGYYTPAIRRIVQEAGYESACAVKHAMSDTQTDAFLLARLMVRPAMTKEKFESMLVGGNVSPLTSLVLRARTPAWRIVRHGSVFVSRHLQGREQAG